MYSKFHSVSAEVFQNFLASNDKAINLLTSLNLNRVWHQGQIQTFSEVATGGD